MEYNGSYNQKDTIGVTENDLDTYLPPIHDNLNR